MSTYEITTGGEEYALDVLSAIAVTRVEVDGTGHDTDPVELPGDLRDRIADQLAERWAAMCETRLVEPAERHLARWMVRQLLPDPADADDTGLDELLRQRWTQGRAA